MTGTHTHHQINASEIVHNLIARAKPMITDDGSSLPNTGYLKTKLHGSKISHINTAVEIVTWVATPKFGVINFVFEGKRYTAKIGKPTTSNRQLDNREYIFTWDHRDDMAAVIAALTPSDLWEGVQPAPVPNLIVKNFDNYLRNYWFHVSVNFVKTEIVDVDSKRGDEIKALLQNPPAGKRYVSSKAFGVEKWNLVDLPPTA